MADSPVSTPAAVLGVDIGTSSSKGVVVGLDGRVLASSTIAHRPDQPAPDRFEMDAGVWWEEFCRIARELVRSVDVPIIAVGVSGMGPCVLVTDGDGVPLRPAILYGVDARATAEIDELDTELGRDEILRVSGSPLTTQSVGPKLRWLRRHEPEVASRARRLFMPSSWLVYRLTGEYVLDRHSASQSTPLFDLEQGEWHTEWASELLGGIEPPRLGWAGERAGTVHAEAARESGLPAGIPVVFGTIDAWAESASVGALSVGTLVLMYGTTLFLGVTLDRPLTSPRLWGNVGLRPGTRHLSGSLSASGAITEWMRRLTGSADHHDLNTAAKESGPGARGLLMLPYFAGERTPILDPASRGVIAGLRLDHGAGDLYRATLEGTAFAVRHNLDEMRAAGAGIERAVAVGGGTQSSLWLQIVSDVIGIDQAVRTTTVGASYGGALLAAGLEEEVDIEVWNPVSFTIRADDGAVYDPRYRLFRELYPATAGIVHELAAG